MCDLQKKPLIQKCVLICVPGIDVELWEEHKVSEMLKRVRSQGMDAVLGKGTENDGCFVRHTNDNDRESSHDNSV